MDLQIKAVAFIHLKPFLETEVLSAAASNTVRMSYENKHDKKNRCLQGWNLNVLKHSFSVYQGLPRSFSLGKTKVHWIS